ncbi:hypothetical protein HPB51_022057 [Rhipicephalus microplus]|uniref:Uncharacterized protein n=1 Tax=Rhipicephalus microplus TaxID=6941 RepID=A0A9J6F827_RHIMP|nr:hypothetical protein HPB51_022057 [Rhipicephalus microplus]
MDDGMIRTYFLFEKEDIRKFLLALRIPETVGTVQRAPISGEEALWRLAYMNRRLKDLEDFLCRHSLIISSMTTEVLKHIDEKVFHLLDDVNNHTWFTIDELQNFTKVRSNKSRTTAAF